MKSKIFEIFLSVCISSVILNGCSNSLGNTENKSDNSTSGNTISNSQSTKIASIHTVTYSKYLESDLYGLFLSENGNILSDGIASTEFYRPVDLNDTKEIFGHGEDYCSLTNNNKLYCWGSNKNGSVGNGSYNSTEKGSTVVSNGNISFSAETYEPYLVLENVAEAFAYITLHNYFDLFCAVTLDKKLYCWGENKEDGLFGTNIIRSNTPTLIDENVIHLDKSDYKTVRYIKENGEVYSFMRDGGIGQKFSGGCGFFGSDYKGSDYCTENRIDVKQLINENRIKYLLYSNGELKNLDNYSKNYTYKYNAIASYSAGNIFVDFICGIRESGEIDCWGENSSEGKLFGLGNEGKLFSDEPLQVSGIEDAISFPHTIINDDQMCVLAENNFVKCWGDGIEGVKKVDLNSMNVVN